jgi:hypothetical protein
VTLARTLWMRRTGSKGASDQALEHKNCVCHKSCPVCSESVVPPIRISYSGIYLQTDTLTSGSSLIHVGSRWRHSKSHTDERRIECPQKIDQGSTSAGLEIVPLGTQPLSLWTDPSILVLLPELDLCQKT